MQQQTAVVIGASGMIGNLLTELLLNDSNFSIIRVLVRKPLNFSHPKLQHVITDFQNLPDFKEKLGNGDAIFSCIGTTQGEVKGDKQKYRQIDFDIPNNAAIFGKEAGFKTFLLVSAIGANSQSSNFYLKLKGEVEESIKAKGFSGTHIFQPSMLLGNRKNKRIAETIIQPIMQVLSFIFISGLKKFKAIHGKDVAKAMVDAAKNSTPGYHVYEYEEMMKLSGGKG